MCTTTSLGIHILPGSKEYRSSYGNSCSHEIQRFIFSLKWLKLDMEWFRLAARLGVLI